MNSDKSVTAQGDAKAKSAPIEDGILSELPRKSGPVVETRGDQSYLALLGGLTGVLMATSAAAGDGDPWNQFPDHDGFGGDPGGDPGGGDLGGGDPSGGDNGFLDFNDSDTCTDPGVDC